MFDMVFKRVNKFEYFRTELVEGKEKRAGTELIQENKKKQKVEDDKETTELKQCLEIIPDEEEVTIDAIPLSVKSPSIIGWKIYKEGRKSYYQIMRADGKSQTYMIFSQMLKNFDKEDLEDLYKLEKKLIIDYESKMAYQLLKFIIKQLKKLRSVWKHPPDEAVYKELGDNLVRAATTASSLEAEHDNGNINKTQSKATPNESSFLGTTLGGGPRWLSARVESSGDEEDLGKDASKQGRRIHDIDADEDITLVNDDNEMFDVDALAGEEVFVAEQSENVVEGSIVVNLMLPVQFPVSAATITDVENLLSLVEQVKPMKRLEQMRLDEELAFKLQAEEEEEERLAREKANELEKST
ncbi:hypothetical protein Tco_0661487 [Tanacetum coccineum]